MAASRLLPRDLTSWTDLGSFLDKPLETAPAGSGWLRPLTMAPTSDFFGNRPSPRTSPLTTARWLAQRAFLSNPILAEWPMRGSDRRLMRPGNFHRMLYSYR